MIAPRLEAIKLPNMPSQGSPGKCLLLCPPLNDWIVSRGSGSRSIIEIWETLNPGFIVLEKTGRATVNPVVVVFELLWQTRKVRVQTWRRHNIFEHFCLEKGTPA